MALNEKLKSLLLEAGLNESEIIVYLELLKSHAQTKWELVGRTGLDRNKVYRAFEKLQYFRMIERNKFGIKALSLKAFIEELNRSQRQTGKLVHKLRSVAPFLRLGNEAVEEIESAYTQSQIIENYLFMSEVKYDTCLDFGDLEQFVDSLGGLKPVFKFRRNRFKQEAKNIAICTTIGPNTNCMARKKDMNKFKSNIDYLNINFEGKWVIFSDTNDYVMFNDVSDQEAPTSIMIKSKIVAESQRLLFDQFYQNLEKF